MAQFARPDSDVNVGNWQDESGGTTSIFQSIDEATRSDTDYVTSETAPANSVYVCGLSNVTDPESSSSHTVTYAYQKDPSGGSQVDLTVELRQGYVDEVTQGTLIASWSHANVANGFVEQTQTLSTAEADSITDYSDLSLRFVANQV